MKIYTLFLIILLALNVGALCAGETLQNLSKVYLGVGGGYASFFAGDFDGGEYYSSGDDFLFPVYQPEAGFGWEILVGYENGRGLCIEMGACQTYHQAFWQAVKDFEETGILSPGDKIDTQLSSSVFYVDMKQKLLLKSYFQPYWRAGFGFMSTSSDQGYMGVNENLKGGFGGVSIRGGIGLEVFVHPQISLAAEGVYQFGMFNSAEWDGGSASIEPRLFVHEINLSLWAVYKYPLNF